MKIWPSHQIHSKKTGGVFADKDKLLGFKSNGDLSLIFGLLNQWRAGQKKKGKAVSGIFKTNCDMPFFHFLSASRHHLSFLTEGWEGRWFSLYFFNAVSKFCRIASVISS